MENEPKRPEESHLKTKKQRTHLLQTLANKTKDERNSLQVFYSVD